MFAAPYHPGQERPGERRTAIDQQVLEAILLYKDDAGIHHAYPRDAETLMVAWVPGLHPGEVIVDATAEAGLSPFMVHSTSWRMQDGDIVLTFLVMVEPPTELHVGFEEELVTRAELARGHAMGPPAQVHTTQVVEHGLRHLAWLVSDDPAIRKALPDWTDVLTTYDREPFRAFEGGP